MTTLTEADPARAAMEALRENQDGTDFYLVRFSDPEPLESTFLSLTFPLPS
jgi:hypothetical protein